MRRSAERKRPRKAGEIDTQILERIAHADKPVKAYEIVRRSAIEGDPLLPVQVYRSLDRLKANGKIERVATLNAFVPSETDRPVHFLCTDCGSVGTTEAHETHGLLSQLCSDHGFSAHEPHLEISGHCGQCEEAENE